MTEILFTICGLLVSTVALLLATEGRASATNHDLHIKEILAGANGDSKIQFIVIEQKSPDQNLWGPQFSETQSRAMLVFFDATGRETGMFKFPSDPPTGGSLLTLVATQGFANLPGAPAPDVVIPPLLTPVSGKVCFKSNPANSVFPRNNCVSYGNFTGDPEGGGPPAAALPIVNTVSLKATTSTDRNSDFQPVTTPTPENIAGDTFTMLVDTQIVQGRRLFNRETFLGNGRTCGSCHVTGESFRLPPSNIQSRFTTLVSTLDPLLMFDPLFIAENAPSSFDEGFDFNLNTLVLTAPVSSNAPCTGELRGIITNPPNDGLAKVLTRISPTTYLVYGGRSPLLSGAVTDGICSATVADVIPGDLGAIPGSDVPGLEDPQRMRKSVDATNFPQGRGLILENIDGFANPAVFRKSPHLLNLSRTAPFGFSGDIPDLQTFATGAVRQHFPRTLARTDSGADPDFRLPRAGERAAMEAFMLSQEFPAGNDPDKFNLDRFAITTTQQQGRAAFFGAAKCSQCHGGPVLSQTTVSIQGKGVNINASFNTGVMNQPINAPGADNLPCEPSVVTVGPCGSREFSVPQLFNIKNLGPFFHDDSAATVRQTVEFYTSAAFNTSPAGQAIGGIIMSAQTIDAITAFLEGLGPQLRINDVTKAEGNTGTTAFTFTVTLLPAAASRVTVNCVTANGTATAPSDYTAVNIPLAFTSGQTSKTCTVPVKGNTVVEPNEFFRVNLTNVVGPATIFDGQGIGTIVNDD